MDKQKSHSWLRGGLLLISAILACPTTADSWIPAHETQVFSADGQTRVTVMPRELDGALAYFQDKVEGRELAGQASGDARHSATARMEKCEGRRWTLVWEKPLVNDVAPVTTLVANDGRFLVTFDNWHSMGLGEDVVVIYGSDGRVMHRYSLEDLIPRDYLMGLPRSVSSLHWRGEVRLVDEQKTLRIDLIKASGDAFRDPEFLPLEIRLADGRITLPTGEAWQQALLAARREVARQRDDYERFRQRRAQPLVAPQGSDQSAWTDYLLEVGARIWDDPTGTPMPMLLPPTADPMHGRRLEQIEGAIGSFANKDEFPGFQSTYILASPESRLLAERVIMALDRLPAAAALEQNIIFIGLPEQRDALTRAVERTGAGFRFVDMTQPLPGMEMPTWEEHLEK